METISFTPSDAVAARYRKENRAGRFMPNPGEGWGPKARALSSVVSSARLAEAAASSAAAAVDDSDGDGEAEGVEEREAAPEEKRGRFE